MPYGENGRRVADVIPCERDQMAAPKRKVAVDQRTLVEQARRGDHDAFAVLDGVVYIMDEGNDRIRMVVP